MRRLSLKFNPFERVDHNQWHQTRLFFHLAHLAIGLPVWLVVHVAHLPLAVAIAAGVALAFVDKCLWINWHGARKLNWHLFDVSAPHDWADFTSDLGLTLLGALLPPAAIAVPVYYVLSVFNGT
jgi:hypothetical protein